MGHSARWRRVTDGRAAYRRGGTRWGRGVAVLGAGCAVLSVVAVGPLAGAGAATGASGVVQAVGAENEYANVISQIGGRHVSVRAIESNPNTDPHTFEASASVAEEVGKAELVVQNGLGYDTYMNRIESATPDPSRKVIDVQQLLGLPNSTPNPHLWYKPTTMPAVASAVATDLSSVLPADRAYFTSRLQVFDRSLQPWLSAIASLKTEYGGSAVAVTEPVGDYMLQAAGMDIATPFTLQADIMNGVDPSPQNVSLEDGLLAGRKVKVFVYNQQVVDPLTESFLALARQHHVPVVGVYETMPVPGYDYQSWMLAEVHAVRLALSEHRSTQRL